MTFCHFVMSFAINSPKTAGGPPAVLGELIASDMAKWQKVIQQAGITAE